MCNAAIVSEEWLEVEMIVASTAAFDSRYGPWQFEREQLERLAEQVNVAQAGMILNHDPSEKLPTRDERAEVRIREDGVAELRVTCLVRGADYDAWTRQVRERGAPGGMSVAITSVLAQPEGLAGLSLIGDAADFPEHVLVDLTRQAPGPTTVMHLYQFAADPEAVRMVLGFAMSVISSVPSNLIANWITKAIDTLRREASKQHRPAALDGDVTKPGGDTVRVRYKPDSDDAAVKIVETVMKHLYPTE